MCRNKKIQEKTKISVCLIVMCMPVMFVLQFLLLLHDLKAEVAQNSKSYVRSEQQEVKDDADLHVNRSTVYYRNGDLEGAINELEIAKKLSPQDAQIHFMLGNAYYRKKDWNTAVEKYFKAAGLRPGHPDTFLNLGFSYYKINKLPEAVNAWETCVRLSQQDPMARMALAVGLFSMGSVEDAVFHFSQALSLRPDSCDQKQLAIDIRWTGDALAHVNDLCELLTNKYNSK